MVMQPRKMRPKLGRISYVGTLLCWLNGGSAFGHADYICIGHDGRIVFHHIAYVRCCRPAEVGFLRQAIQAAEPVLDHHFLCGFCSVWIEHSAESIDVQPGHFRRISFIVGCFHKVVVNWIAAILMRVCQLCNHF